MADRGMGCVPLVVVVVAVVVAVAVGMVMVMVMVVTSIVQCLYQTIDRTRLIWRSLSPSCETPFRPEKVC